MSVKKMLVNATHPEENRVAIVEDGILSELDIEITGKEQTKGNIYKATVIRVEQGLQAAFVDYGAERLGFLQMGEIHPGLFPKKAGDEAKSRPRVTDILHRGQELLVQVTKEERGNKGAALTTFISLPGRYMVLMPGDNTRGMSRKIPDGAERKQLKEAIQQFELPDEIGYIIRTAAIGQSPDELKRDLQYLLRVYHNVLELSRKVKAPAPVYRESNLMIRSIRDYFTQDMDEVLVDDEAVFKEAKDFFLQVMPDYAKLVKLHQERRPIFSKYQIEDQIETIAHKQVFLPSGGSIVIDSTEALVAIDVNSGKMASEQGVEGTAYKTNLEAADEAARQLRLRDLGGLVVIDFIDMRDRKHIREVEKRLKDALKPDKARVTVGRISQFGLLEMSRQRIKAALAEGAYLPCPNCLGTGRVRSVEAQAIAFLRKLHAAVARGQLEKIEAEIPLAVSHYLLNNKREELVDMERRHQISIIIRGRKSFIADQTELSLTKREKEVKKPADGTEPVTAATTRADSHDQPMIELSTKETPIVTPGETADETPPKKSRNRRRNRKTARPELAGDAAVTAEQTESESEITALDIIAEAPDQPAASEGLEPVATKAEGQAEKRPRRRRGRRSKKPVGTGTTAADSELATSAPDPSSLPVTEVVEATPAETTDLGSKAETFEPAENKPARKRRSRRPKKPSIAVEEAVHELSGAEPELPQVAAENSVTTSGAGAPPVAPITTATKELTAAKPRRGRKPKQPAAADPEAAKPAAAESIAAAADTGEEPLREPATLKKPARAAKTRKPSARPDGTGTTQSQATETPAAKPKPKRAPAKPRKKPAEPADHATAEKPQRKTRSKKPPAEENSSPAENAE
jgi:ribonuclease E